MGDQVKGRSPKKIESLVEVSNVLKVQVHVLSFNMIHISSPYIVLTASYPFREVLGRKVSGSAPNRLE